MQRDPLDAWTPDPAPALDLKLGAHGRVRRERWCEQAHELMHASTGPASEDT